MAREESRKETVRKRPQEREMQGRLEETAYRPLHLRGGKLLETELCSAG